MSHINNLSHMDDAVKQFITYLRCKAKFFTNYNFMVKKSVLEQLSLITADG